MAKYSCNVCGVVFANKMIYLKHLAATKHTNMIFVAETPEPVAAMDTDQITLFKAVTALVHTHGLNKVHNTLALFDRVCQRQYKVNVGYYQRDACKCTNCQVQLKMETRQAEEDFKVWQKEEQQKIADEFVGHEQEFDAVWDGSAVYNYNDYETTESLFD